MLDLFGEIISEANTDKSDFITYEGSFTYYVKAQVKGTLPYSNTTLMIQAYNNRKELKPLKLKCRWYREIGDRNYEITDNKDDSYHINAQDIGCFVKVAVRPKSKRFSKKDIAIVKFGPFEMSDTLSLNLEKDLTNGTHIYQFNLLKHNSQFVNDQSNFQNFVKVDQNGISFQFGFYFELFVNFFLLHNSAHPYRVVCENHDYSVLSIFYVKGTEISFKEDILVDFPKLQEKYKILKEKFLRQTINEKPHVSDKSLSQLDLEFTSRRDQRKQSIMTNNLMLDSYIFDVEDEDEGKEHEIRIKFKTRVERDSFVCLVRAIAAIKTMALAPLMNEIEKVFDGTISEEKNSKKLVEIFDNKYEKVVHRKKELDSSIQRMLDMNKGKNLENENLIQCAELLESDLAMSIAEFKKMMEKLGEKGEAETRKVSQLEKSLLSASRNVEMIRERSMTPSRRAKMLSNAKKEKVEVLGGLENEIEKTDQLNEILVKKIEKLKKENAKNHQKIGSLNEDFENRNIHMNFEKKTKNVKIKGLEIKEAIDKSGVNSIEPKVKKKQEKEQLQRSDENEESMLEEAISNLECSIMDLEELEKKSKEEESKVEIQNQHLRKKIKNCLNEFESLLDISKKIQLGGKIGLMLGINPLAEKIFEYNGAKIKDLQNLILLYEAKFLNQSLRLHEEKFDDEGLVEENKELLEELVDIKDETEGKRRENLAMVNKIGEIQKELGKQRALLEKEEKEKARIAELSKRLQFLQEENFMLIEGEEF